MNKIIDGNKFCEEPSQCMYCNRYNGSNSITSYHTSKGSGTSSRPCYDNNIINNFMVSSQTRPVYRF